MRLHTTNDTTAIDLDQVVAVLPIVARRHSIPSGPSGFVYRIVLKSGETVVAYNETRDEAVDDRDQLISAAFQITV